MNADYLAFDLGAESGRAILGRLRAGILELKDVSRFPNVPVGQPGSLRWDVLRLWSEILKVPSSIRPYATSPASASTPGESTTRSSEKKASSSKTHTIIATTAPTAWWKRSAIWCRAKRSTP